MLWQDIHRNVIHGADAAGVLGEWTAHFGADRTAGHLATELGGYNEYILSMAQYATVGAFLRPDHAGSLLSLSGMLMTYYQPDVVVTGSRGAVAPAQSNRPTTRELIDANYRVAHLNPHGDGNAGAMVGLFFMDMAERRSSGAGWNDAAMAATAVGAVALRRRRGGGRIGDVASHRDNQAAARNTGLDSHHAGQAAAMRRMVPGYDRETAPTILVPREGHTVRNANGDIVSRRTDGINSPRDLLARDIRELRRVYPEIPNSQLRALIEANKRAYPDSLRRRR